MAEEFNAAAVQKMIADAVKPINDAIAPLAAQLPDLVKNQKVLADTIAADNKAKSDAADKAKADAAKTTPATTPAADAPKALTLDDVAKTVTEALKQRDAAAQTTAARDAYIADKLKGVPSVYAAKLGSDPAKWAAEEQAIRDGLKADLAALGVAPKDVSGGNPGGATTAGAATPETIAKLKAAGLTEGEANFAATVKLPG